jgi:hypothetical protein
VFDAFLFDFLRLLLTNEPRHLAQKKEIDVSLALSTADRDGLVFLIAERELKYFDDSWLLAKKLVDDIADTARHRISRSASR